MPQELTYDHVLTLAPDPGTAQRAKSVAHAQRWLTLEGNGRAIWGSLGNPDDPYRTAVDFEGMGFRCSCPVRRLPCKHGIGLLLLFTKANHVFQLQEQPPDWLADWLKKRSEKSVKPSNDAPPSRSPEAEAALAEQRQQNREKRMTQMAAGLAELESWLLDLFRQGLATLEGQASGYFNDLAARMVDAKLGTLARRIRQLPALMAEADWHEKILAEIGDIYLLLRAFQRLDTLPEPLQDDLLSLAGVNLKKETLLAQTGIPDNWLVAGQTFEEEDANLLARRVWLLGEKTGETALLLDFSWGGAGFESNFKLGTVLRAELVFYPSAYPQRALLKQFELSNEPFSLRNGYPSLAAFADAYANALGENPWLGRFSVFFEAIVPVFHQKGFLLVDCNKKQLPIEVPEAAGWRLVALSCGRPIGVFGTWDGGAFTPLSVVVDGLFQPL
ncbi:MAG: SWIM zinc finger family protein [Saprospiraceae bacterium]|nr:SWIM zinc finger family protein [Saprospiraceae bacterium]